MSICPRQRGSPAPRNHLGAALTGRPFSISATEEIKYADEHNDRGNHERSFKRSFDFQGLPTMGAASGCIPHRFSALWARLHSHS